jgi:Site-specific recombinase XerD
MSQKYSNTTADYLNWNEAMNLVRSLAKDGEHKISLLVAIGCFWGLRISDILSLRWKQILNVDEFTIVEKKTGKIRTIRINSQLKRHIADCYKEINPISINSTILISQKGTVYSVQRVNVILKEVKSKYRLSVKNFSCHSLRKTFGRQVYNNNSENAELALVKLMELFNHSVFP